MDIAIEDVLYVRALHHCPYLLQDQELFDALLRFIHALLAQTARQERAATLQRLLRVSSS